MTVGKARVLFLCAHNSARSQIAEGILRSRYEERYEAASAGSRPTAVHPLAIAAMAELGIDISLHRSKGTEGFLGQSFDYVVTLCGDDAPGVCPFFPGGRTYLHQSFPDPARVEGTEEERLAGFRRVRDALAAWLEGVFGAGRGVAGLAGSGQGWIEASRGRRPRAN